MKKKKLQKVPCEINSLKYWLRMKQKFYISYGSDDVGKCEKLLEILDDYIELKQERTDGDIN